MGNGSGVSRGDRNRNARLAQLRGLVPVTPAIVGSDLADAKRMVVVCYHDSKVNTLISTHIMGSPARRLANDHTLPGTIPFS